MELRSIIVIAFLTLGLASCLQEETPVPARPTGDIITEQIAMTNTYEHQIYYDLETASEISSHLKTEWDLGFECNGDQWHIILNTSKLMMASLSEESELKDVMDTNSVEKWMLDGETGDLDSTAIGDWRGANKVYIINRGLNEKGRHQGLYKIIFDDVESGVFTFRFAEISSGEEIEFSIATDPSINFMYFSFDESGSQLALEPEKEIWDLVFTQYTSLFIDLDVPYIVTGVLNNPYMCRALKDTVMDFEDIDRAHALSLELSSRINLPGYEWKTYDFDEGFYVVHSQYTYIIKTAEGLYYKLRFIDFYDETGENGYPKFEFQAL